MRPARSTAVTEPSIRLPAGMAVRPSTVTSPAVVAETVSSICAVALVTAAAVRTAMDVPAGMVVGIACGVGAGAGAGTGSWRGGSGVAAGAGGARGCCGSGPACVACGWAVRSMRRSAARLAVRSRSSAAHSRSVSLGGTSCRAAGSADAVAVLSASVAGPIVQLRQAASPAPRVPLNIESTIARMMSLIIGLSPLWAYLRAQAESGSAGIDAFTIPGGRFPQVNRLPDGVGEAIEPVGFRDGSVERGSGPAWVDAGGGVQLADGAGRSQPAIVRKVADMRVAIRVRLSLRQMPCIQCVRARPRSTMAERCGSSTTSSSCMPSRR